MSAITDDASLAGNPTAAEALSTAGMVVDPHWSALTLGPPEPTLGSALATRPRFEMIREALNKIGDTVNKVGEALPGDVQIPEWSAPERSTVLFRAELPPGDGATRALKAVSEQARVVGVFNDPAVVLAQLSATDPARGTADDAAELMGVARLRETGLDGHGVYVAMVDGGMNMNYLNNRGRSHQFEAALSCTVAAGTHPPGDFPPGHGTLAAFQIGLAAPKATLIDQAVLTNRVATGEGPLIQAWLSDIEPGYVALHAFLRDLEPSQRRLVISNSWAMIKPEWDFPVEHVENFSDNAHHPFNRMVRALVALGADVLFAAGNIGNPYPAVQGGFRTQPICGANSLEEVTTVGAVDIDGERLGYSSQGPGRLALEKPDVCGYSHYVGSEIEPVDWGTSTACPGVAGVVAAIRTRYSAVDLSPVELKALLLESARRPNGTGYNPDTGYGVVDAAALVARLP